VLRATTKPAARKAASTLSTTSAAEEAPKRSPITISGRGTPLRSAPSSASRGIEWQSIRIASPKTACDCASSDASFS
jgi:hypothetical protein